MKLEIQPIPMWSNNINLFKPFFFLLLYSLLYSVNLYAKDEASKIRPTLLLDSSRIEVRKPSADQQKELLQNKDYQYDRVGPAAKTPWQRFKEWLGRRIDEMFSSTGGKIGVRIFQYILVATAIVLIIFLLLKNNLRSLFYGKSASVVIDFKEFEENIHTINFEELIAEAISKKDFRKAIRLHFLKLLKELTDHNLIKWQIDKTNNDYSMELSNNRYSKHFRELAELYEYIWYGDFQLDETRFQNSVAKFREFKIYAN